MKHEKCLHRLVGAGILALTRRITLGQASASPVR